MRETEPSPRCGDGFLSRKPVMHQIQSGILGRLKFVQIQECHEKFIELVGNAVGVAFMKEREELIAMKFNKYYFENFSSDTPFDINNPRYVLGLVGVDSVLERIVVSSPYSLTIEDFDNVDLVNALLHIDVLQLKNDKIGMAVPFFVSQDADILKELSKRVANDIATELLAHKEQIVKAAERIDNGYPVERNLYHILCAYILDGLMFDYLEENGLVTTSCVHNSGLDYLVILYEDTACLNEYSNMLLCSYNRLMANGKGFVSFGDSHGIRNDFYRYNRQRELNLLSEQERKYITCSTETLIENFDRMADGDKVERRYVEIYERFGYCQDGKIVVPVYNACSFEIADKLYDFIVEIVKTHIIDVLTAIQCETRLLAIAHEVKVKDIANEIYHLIFGEVNEILVRSGLVSTPPYYQGEGRYFKSFER